MPSVETEDWIGGCYVIVAIYNQCTNARFVHGIVFGLAVVDTSVVRMDILNDGLDSFSVQKYIVSI